MNARNGRWATGATTIFAIVVTSCARGSVPLSDSHAALARDVGFPPLALQSIRDAGERLRRLQARRDDGEFRPGPGVTIAVARGRVSGTISALRAQLGPEYFVFRSEQHFGQAKDEVSVIKTTDQFEALRVMQTNGWNYDLSPDSVIARLKQWDAQYGLSLDGVAYDWVEGEIQRPPQDMLAFAKVVYEFCPDIVDQGTETVTRLADEMRRSKRLYLWWD